MVKKMLILWTVDERSSGVDSPDRIRLRRCPTRSTRDGWIKSRHFSDEPTRSRRSCCFTPARCFESLARRRSSARSGCSWSSCRRLGRCTLRGNGGMRTRRNRRTMGCRNRLSLSARVGARGLIFTSGTCFWCPPARTGAKGAVGG